MLLSVIIIPMNDLWAEQYQEEVLNTNESGEVIQDETNDSLSKVFCISGNKKKMTKAEMKRYREYWSDERFVDTYYD